MIGHYGAFSAVLCGDLLLFLFFSFCLLALGWRRELLLPAFLLYGNVLDENMNEEEDDDNGDRSCLRCIARSIPLAQRLEEYAIPEQSGKKVFQTPLFDVGYLQIKSNISSRSIAQTTD